MDQPSPTRTRLPPAAPSYGRRELNKIDKAKRITDAARVVFETRGYDEATTRKLIMIGVLQRRASRS